MNESCWVPYSGLKIKTFIGEFYDNDMSGDTHLDGDKFWYRKGRNERLGGPSKIYTDGTKQFDDKWIDKL